MRYIGLMSGTSVDNVDASLIEITPAGAARIRAHHRHPIPDDLRIAIHELIRHPAADLDRIGEMDVRLGRLFADAANTLLAQAGLQSGDVRAVGSHGQTVRHRPDAGYPFTLQIGDPSVIAELTGITTVADFRRRDVAAGGQGAPLVPAFHAVQFRSNRYNRLILNLGGIANVTYLPSDPNRDVTGFDTGPGNTLLDQWIGRHRGERYDRDGEWAGSGQFSHTLLNTMLADSYFALAPPKSAGREHFHLDWISDCLDSSGPSLRPVDVQATLLHLTARSVVNAVRRFVPAVDEIYVCGGGAHNRALMKLLSELIAPVGLQTTEPLGIHPDWVEAAAFAWLAHRTMALQPGNLPGVTGARSSRILGGVYYA